jgi:hypothetical protein
MNHAVINWSKTFLVTPTQDCTASAKRQVWAFKAI